MHINYATLGERVMETELQNKYSMQQHAAEECVAAGTAPPVQPQWSKQTIPSAGMEDVSTLIRLWAPTAAGSPPSSPLCWTTCQSAAPAPSSLRPVPGYGLRKGFQARWQKNIARPRKT